MTYFEIFVTRGVIFLNRIFNTAHRRNLLTPTVTSEILLSTKLWCAPGFKTDFYKHKSKIKQRNLLRHDITNDVRTNTNMRFRAEQRQIQQKKSFYVASVNLCGKVLLCMLFMMISLLESRFRLYDWLRYRNILRAQLKLTSHHLSFSPISYAICRQEVNRKHISYIEH